MVSVGTEAPVTGAAGDAPTGGDVITGTGVKHHSNHSDRKNWDRLNDNVMPSAAVSNAQITITTGTVTIIIMIRSGIQVRTVS